MYFQLKKIPFLSNCSFRVIILAFLWTAGLLLGILLGRRSDTFLSLMRAVPDSRVSIVGLLTVYALPYLISLAATSARTLAFVYIFTLFRSVISGLLHVGLFMTYGSAAWLISFLFCSDWAVNFIVLWLFLQNRQLATQRYRQFCVSAGSLTTVAVFDILFFTPFLVKILG